MSLSTNAYAGDPGRTIGDPITGETITFLETAEESGGNRVVMRVDLSPGTVVPPHAHPMKEVFECLEGQLEFELEGRKIGLLPGTTVSVPANRIHGMRNTSQETTSVRVIGTPGAIAEYGLRVKFLLSRDGYLPTGGGPPRHLLLAAVVLDRGGLYFPPIPVPVFRLLIAGLAALGRWRGREKFLLGHYPEYGRYLEALGKRRGSPAGDPGTRLEG